MYRRSNSVSDPLCVSTPRQSSSASWFRGSGRTATPASTTSSAANGGRYSTALAADDLCVTLEGARFHGAQLALGQLEPHQLRGRRQVVVAQSLQDVAVEPQVAQLDTHTQTNPSSID